jgi:hypothetical protein
MIRMSTSTNDDLAAVCRAVARRHHILGWSALLLFLSLGSLLEAFHGFKIDFYLDPGNKLRRQLWTLAHAHGTLLALIQIGFAAGVERFGVWTAGRLKLASFFLLDAAVFVPLGFFLGGIKPSDSDPWIGILLVPIGALLLFIGVGMIIHSALQGSGGRDQESGVRSQGSGVRDQKSGVRSQESGGGNEAIKSGPPPTAPNP